MGKNKREIDVPIIGVWKLVSFEIQKESGEVIHPFGKDARGILVYSESGHYAVQLTRADRPHFESGDQMKGTVEEIKDNFEGCIAYFGPYALDREGGYVLHHVEGSLFPNWERGYQKRYYDLSGDRLTLSTPPLLWGGGGEIVAVVTWERVD